MCTSVHCNMQVLPDRAIHPQHTRYVANKQRTDLSDHDEAAYQTEHIKPYKQPNGEQPK